MSKETSIHNSYAIVSFSRCESSGSGINFFGSKIKCNSFIKLQISHCELERSLSHDHYFPREKIIELRLSPNQFAELLTNMNTTGIPATIQYTQALGRLEDPPYESEIKQFASEIEDISKDMRQAISEHESLLNSLKLTKIEKAKIHSSFCMLKNSIIHNMPFVVQSAFKALDRAATEAKLVVDSFIQGAISRLGLKSLQALGTPEVSLLEDSDKDMPK